MLKKINFFTLSCMLSVHGFASKPFEGWKNYPEMSHIEAAKSLNDGTATIYLSWKRLTTNSTKLVDSEATNFALKYPYWHDLPLSSKIKKHIENEINFNTTKEDIRKLFANTKPNSTKGKLLYLVAFKGLLDDDAFKNEVKETWALSSFKENQHNDFLKNYGNYLTQQDHIRRVDNLLYKGYITESKLMLPLLNKSWQDITNLRIAIRSNASNMEDLLSKASSDVVNNEGVRYERVRWRNKNKNQSGAIDLIIENERPSDWSSLWWSEQKKLWQYSMDNHKYLSAHSIASRYPSVTIPNKIANYGELYAGLAALKTKGKEGIAKQHFINLYNNEPSYGWKSESAYYAAMAAKKVGDLNEAQNWLKQSAQYPHHYYGIISANKANIDTDSQIKNIRLLPITTGKQIQPLPQSGQNIMANIAKRIVNENRSYDASSFMRAACPNGSGADIIKKCALFAKQIGLPDAAVRLAMSLDYAGEYMLYSELYPTIELPLITNASGTERLEPALIHAIIRQESLFDEDIGSHAGAQGLMQLMPATAKMVASQYNLGWSGVHNLHVSNYNIKLGTHYLADQVKRYNGSYILALVAYNAGPGRANSWIKIYGDPRSPKVDAFAWIENIPFDETRNYVKKVLANLIVYRSLLNDEHASEKLTDIIDNGGIPKRLKGL